MNKLGKVKLNKKGIKRIEISIVLIIVISVIIILIATRTLSSEKAQMIVEEQYN